MADKKIDSLLSLLDENDEEIVEQVKKELYNIDLDSFDYLLKKMNEEERLSIKKILYSIVQSVNYEIVRQKIEIWRYTAKEDLLKGFWFLASFDDPNFNYEDLEKQINLLSDEFGEMLDDEIRANPLLTIKKMNYFFYNVKKFKTKMENNSPGHFLIHKILKFGTGHPILMSCLYSIICKKNNISIEPINFPALFFLKFNFGEESYFIDVSSNGLIFSKEDVLNYCQNLFLEPKNIYFENIAPTKILKLVLHNLINIYENIEEFKKQDQMKTYFQLVEG